MADRRGQDSLGHRLGDQDHRERLWGILRPRLRPDGRSQEGMDRAEPVPTDEVCLAPKVLVVHEFGIWPPTTGRRPPPSLPWSRPATSEEASSSLPTRASASGANFWATPYTGASQVISTWTQVTSRPRVNHSIAIVLLLNRSLIAACISESWKCGFSSFTRFATSSIEVSSCAPVIPQTYTIVVLSSRSLARR